MMDDAFRNGEARTLRPSSELARIAGFLRRRYKLVFAGAIAMAVATATFLFFTVPTYQAAVRIVLTEDRTKLLEEISGVEATRNADEYIATQIGLIGSENVARKVVDNLDLTANPTFMNEKPSALAVVQRWLGEYVLGKKDESGADEADAKSQAVNLLMGRLSAYRIEQSYLIEVTYRSPDPKLARDIAAAYGDAYLEDQTDSYFAAVSKASTWLEGRIEELRKQSLEASQSVEAFRAQHDLVAANGQLVSEQNLLGLNTQMVLAESDYARSEAKLKIYEDVLASGDVEAIIGVVTKSPELSQDETVRTLRAQYLQAVDREKEIAARWGNDNPQVAAVRVEKDRLARVLADEAKRVVGSYRNDLDIGRSQIDRLNSSIRTASGKTQVANSIQVTLKSLEQRSASYQAIYQSYLTRYQETVQQQSLPLNTARIVSQAQMPEEPIFPKPKIIMALAIVLGACGGAGAGIVRELRDRTFRTYEQVDAAGMNFLGYLPHVGRADQIYQIETAGGRASADGRLNRASIRFLETLRNVKAASDQGKLKNGKVVGVVSLLAGEERSGIALNLANLHTLSGKRVLLIDGSTHDPILSSLLADPRKGSFLDVLSEEKSFDDVTVKLASGVVFLPSPQRQSAASPRLATVVPVLYQFLESWRRAFDVVIVDFPPIGSTSDATVVAEDLDQIVLAIEWGQTNLDRVEYALQSNYAMRSKLLGAVLTHVDLSKLRRYDPLDRLNNQSLFAKRKVTKLA